MIVERSWGDRGGLTMWPRTGRDREGDRGLVRSFHSTSFSHECITQHDRKNITILLLSKYPFTSPVSIRSFLLHPLISPVRRESNHATHSPRSGSVLSARRAPILRPESARRARPETARLGPAVARRVLFSVLFDPLGRDRIRREKVHDGQHQHAGFYPCAGVSFAHVHEKGVLRVSGGGTGDERKGDGVRMIGGGTGDERKGTVSA